MLLMWLGEQITERGHRQRRFAGHHHRHPGPPAAGRRGARWTCSSRAAACRPSSTSSTPVAAGPAAGGRDCRGDRGHPGPAKIPVQYAQRAVGRKVYAGGTSFMPLRVNYAGVMPIIFAQAILMFPQKIFSTLAGLTRARDPGCQAAGDVRSRGAAPGRASLVYLALYGLMILFFSYFWVATQFNETADRRRPEEERRLHSRGASRPGHQRFPAQRHEPDHPGGRRSS